MIFELDPDKSEANKAKHGIDFVEAQQLWRDPLRFEIPSSQAHHGEDRQLLIACYNGRCWVAITTVRDDAIRIISVRRARDYEEAAYDQA